MQSRNGRQREGSHAQKPRTFRLSLLRIEVRLREVTRHTTGLMEREAAAATTPVSVRCEKAKTTEAVRMQAAGTTNPKQVTAQHAPKFPKGMCPSACHTIGGTGAEKRAREYDGKNAILLVPKHLVFQVHVDEHPVGTGEAATDAETCTERGGDITIRHEGGQ